MIVPESQIANWRLPSEGVVAWRHWGGEYVVHHAVSNDTYRVTELAGRILQALLRAGTQDVDSLVRECGAGEDEVVHTLEVLAGLDLVIGC